MTLPRYARILLILVGLILAFAIGSLLNRGSVTSVQTADSEWTCSMHPQIRQPDPGLCPLCAMDLIPVATGGSAQPGAREIVLGPAAEKRAEIATARLFRDQARHELTLTGRVELAETGLHSVSARSAGRIDSLFADSVGQQLAEAEVLAEIYSPELLSAQEELLQSVGTGDETAAREKLRLLGIAAVDIDAVITTGRVSERLPLRAPSAGVVLEKPILEGDHVRRGETLLTIADLSRVWALFDVWEQDLHLVAVGQQIEFSAEALPGQTFTGLVSFLDPVLNDQSRSLALRVEMDNSAGLLRPGLFLRGTLRAPYGAEKEPLLLPATAPLLTGRRAVVYVSLGQGRYEGREVVLGPRVGDFYIVRGGLDEGEEVVVRGAFKLDSDLQIRGGPSMMTISAGLPEAFLATLSPLYQSYFSLAEDLSLDRVGTSRPAVVKALESIRDDLLCDEDQERFAPLLRRLGREAKRVAAAPDLEAARVAFEPLSIAMITMASDFGAAAGDSVLLFHCPMAFDWRGADWLQGRDGVENPYFGSRMYRCGTREQVLSGGTR